MAFDQHWFQPRLRIETVRLTGLGEGSASRGLVGVRKSVEWYLIEKKSFGVTPPTRTPQIPSHHRVLVN